MNLNEVKDTIRDGNQAAKEAKALLDQAGTEADSTAQLATRTVYDSQDEDAQAGLEMLKESCREIELTIRRIDAAVDHANAYLTALG